MKKIWFIFSLMLGIGFGFPATPSRATQFVYVVNQSDSTVSGYSVDRKTGGLIPVPGSPFPTGSFPRSVAVDPRAQFVFAANSASNNVSVYRIDPKTGALTSVPGSPFEAGAFLIQSRWTQRRNSPSLQTIKTIPSRATALIAKRGA
jgi:Lactonase, 7-bladed beta-propeller